MKPKISEQLAKALNLLREIEKEYQYNSAKLQEAEKVKIDLLHFFEFVASNNNERNRLGTRLRRCLLERRKYKDGIEVMTPYADFMSRPENQDLLNKLARVLGDIRKRERHLEARSYMPRILPWPTAKPNSAQFKSAENDEHNGDD